MAFISAFWVSFWIYDFSQIQLVSFNRNFFHWVSIWKFDVPPFSFLFFFLAIPLKPVKKSLLFLNTILIYLEFSLQHDTELVLSWSSFNCVRGTHKIVLVIPLVANMTLYKGTGISHFLELPYFTLPILVCYSFFPYKQKSF